MNYRIALLENSGYNGSPETWNELEDQTFGARVLFIAEEFKMNRYLWWQKGVIYQICPRSFQDSNKDGIDEGLLLRLD